MANRPPTRAAALLMPEAVLPLSSGAALRTVVVRGATLTVMPVPTIIRPGRNPDQKLWLSPESPSTIKPKAVIDGPAISGSRAPKRATRPPDQRDPKPMMMENGRKAAPAPVVL